MSERMMKALVLSAPYIFNYMEVPVPRLGPGEILIAVKACAVSATDRLLYTGARKAPGPLVPGREAQGTVEAVSADAEGFSVGDRVAVASSSEAVREPGEGESGLLLGGFAEYMKAPASACVKIPDILDDYAGAMLFRTRMISQAVYGAGKKPATPCVLDIDRFGLLAVPVARFFGYAPLIAVGEEGPMERAARRLGADAFFDETQIRKDPAPLLDALSPEGGAGLVVLARGDSRRAFDPSAVLSGDGVFTEIPLGSSGAGDDPGLLEASRMATLLAYERIDPRPAFSKAAPLKGVAEAIKEWEADRELLQVFCRPGLKQEFVFSDARKPFGAELS